MTSPWCTGAIVFGSGGGAGGECVVELLGTVTRGFSSRHVFAANNALTEAAYRSGNDFNTVDLDPFGGEATLRSGTQLQCAAYDGAGDLWSIDANGANFDVYNGAGLVTSHTATTWGFSPGMVYDSVNGRVLVVFGCQSFGLFGFDTVVKIAELDGAGGLTLVDSFDVAGSSESLLVEFPDGLTALSDGGLLLQGQALPVNDPDFWIHHWNDADGFTTNIEVDTARGSFWSGTDSVAWAGESGGSIVGRSLSLPGLVTGAESCTPLTLEPDLAYAVAIPNDTFSQSVCCTVEPGGSELGFYLVTPGGGGGGGGGGAFDGAFG